MVSTNKFSEPEYVYSVGLHSKYVRFHHSHGTQYLKYQDKLTRAKSVSQDQCNSGSYL